MEKCDEILTLDEVAEFLKVGKRTLYRLASGGAIPAFKLGGSWRFRREDLDRWISSRMEGTDSTGPETPGQADAQD